MNLLYKYIIFTLRNVDKLIIYIHLVSKLLTIDNKKGSPLKRRLLL
jgi:hypothetical protein